MRLLLLTDGLVEALLPVLTDEIEVWETHNGDWDEERITNLRYLASKLRDPAPPEYRDDDAGVTYHPFVGPNGELGFRAVRDGGGEQRIVFNPSGGSDDGVPNVFVYMGSTGDASIDTPVHHYVMRDVGPDEGVDGPGDSDEGPDPPAAADVSEVLSFMNPACTPHSVAPPRPPGYTLGRIRAGLDRVEGQVDHGSADGEN